MAIFKPSRLRRVLNPIIGTGPMFTLYTPSFSAYEDDITSITMNRGTSGRNVGHNPSTLEVGMVGRRDELATGDAMRLYLREEQASALAAFIGATTASIMQRFYGRLGVIGVDDTGRKFHTDASGSSWMTQMNYSPAKFAPSADELLSTLYVDMTKSNQPIRGIDFGTVLGAVNITHYMAGETQVFKDGIGTYAADIGIFFQERRDGKTYAYSHTSRIALVNALVSDPSVYPLMRSQAISPGRYEQPNERPAKRVEYTVHNATGGLTTRVAEIENHTGELREIEVVDWSHWRASNDQNQLNLEAYARVYDSSARLYRLPTINVDLLLLLRDGRDYARNIVRQMLELEVGEPVFLSGDWPPKTQGVHFADGITETIGPDEWTITLSLVPHAAATGQPGPTVVPRAWDSANYQWKTETRKWDKA